MVRGGNTSVSGSEFGSNEAKNGANVDNSSLCLLCFVFYVKKNGKLH